MIQRIPGHNMVFRKRSVRGWQRWSPLDDYWYDTGFTPLAGDIVLEYDDTWAEPEE